MQLDPAEKRSIWWKGALMGALKGIPIGLAMGVGGVLLIWGLAAAFPALGLASTFANFIFDPVALQAGTLAVKFVPFTAFNMVFSLLTGLFTGGGQAVATYHQRKHNLRDEAKLIELDGRTQALEQEMTRSQHVQKILENRPRAASGYRDAEVARKAETPATPTLH